jgi:hypothetical protein
MSLMNITFVPDNILEAALMDDFKVYPYLGFSYDELRRGYWGIECFKSRSPEDIFFYSRDEIQTELDADK